ncbi:MAG: gamma carbonic anhydrase family protein [Stagnimonas sp.]|nr:gamma carbonic anhydrase family protein [Stagnimonas sp.]
MLYALDDHRPRLLGGNHYIADSAAVIGQVVLHEGASVWFGAILRGDTEPITIGERSNVQDGSVLHTDLGVPLSIGRDCTIGHQVMLHGCTIGDNCVIGIQSVVLNRAVIGRNSIVGAGTVIPEGKVFPEGVLILGSPGKVVRELTPQQIAFITLSAQHYVQNGQRFAKGLRPLSLADCLAA